MSAATRRTAAPTRPDARTTKHEFDGIIAANFDASPYARQIIATNRREAFKGMLSLGWDVIRPNVRLRLPHPRFDARQASRLLTATVTTLGVAAMLVGLVATGNFNLPSFHQPHATVTVPAIAGSTITADVPPQFGPDDRSLADVPRLAPAEVKPTVKTVDTKAPASQRHAVTNRVATVSPSRTADPARSTAARPRTSAEPRTTTATRTATTTRKVTTTRTVSAPATKVAVGSPAAPATPKVTTPAPQPPVTKAPAPASQPVVQTPAPTNNFVGGTTAAGTTGSQVIDQHVAGGTAADNATPDGAGNSVSAPPVTISD